ncbi:MAG: hypothetical protein EA409_06335 [Saprospirales bacterium]|nr:MAG: hypothetical protein EA409_06335 [Saprospirales bacterium]
MRISPQAFLWLCQFYSKESFPQVQYQPFSTFSVTNSKPNPLLIVINRAKSEYFEFAYCQNAQIE